MGCVRIQLILDDNIWSAQYTIAKNTNYSDSSMEWSLLNFDFTVEIYCINLIFGEIDSRHADMCFSNTTKTHSIY